MNHIRTLEDRPGEQTFKADVKILDNNTITVDGKPVKVVSSRDPLKLPWAELGIDIVIEVSPVLSFFNYQSLLKCKIA